MKNFPCLVLPLALVFGLAFSGCNPDCQSLQNVRISTTTLPAGYEVLITATPTAALKGKKVSFNGVEAKTRFVDDFGLIAEVPLVSGKAEIRIEDPDCTDFFTQDFTVVGTDYFNSVENFSPPLPPDIVIPDFSGDIYPTSIDKAWLSPDNARYCLWFTSRKDTVTNPNGTKTVFERPTLDENQSFEQSTCGCDRKFSVSGLPYAQNHISGIVDKDNNYIHIFIDRTPILGGTVEEFVGHFVNRDVTPYAQTTGKIVCSCPPPPNVINPDNPATTNKMMLLTSLKTGKQVCAYQVKF